MDGHCLTFGIAQPKLLLKSQPPNFLHAALPDFTGPLPKIFSLRKGSRIYVTVMLIFLLLSDQILLGEGGEQKYLREDLLDGGPCGRKPAS